MSDSVPTNDGTQERHGNRLTRRGVIKLGGGIAASSVASPLLGARASQSDAQFEGTLRFTPGNRYFPTEPTETEPDPPTIMNTLVAEYEEAHPGVTIELVQIPSDTSSDTWRVTSFQGGTEPHILMNNYIRVWQEQSNDWYVPLNEYIDSPNPYIPDGEPGSERWREEMPDRVWDTTRHASGNQYLITTDALVAGMVYNKDIFEKAGLPTDSKGQPSLWSSWKAMLDDLVKLKDAGYEPVAMTMNESGPYNYNWVDGIVLTSVFYDLLPKMGEPADSNGLPAFDDPRKWHALSQEEVSCAIQSGVFSATDPRYGDFVDIMKEYQEYWVSGYTSVSSDETYRLFVTQTAPLLMSITSENTARLQRDADFEFGATAFPPIGEDTSSFAANVQTSFLVGGFTDGYTVTKRAEEEDLVPLAVDFLQFLSAQPQWSRVVEDAPRAVPTAIGLSIPEVLKEQAEFLKLPVRAFKDPDPRLSKRYGVEHRRQMQQFFTDQVGKDDLIDLEDNLMTSEAEKVIEENNFTCKVSEG